MNLLTFFLSQVWSFNWHLWNGLFRRSGASWLPCGSSSSVQGSCWDPTSGHKGWCHEMVPGEIWRCDPQQVTGDCLVTWASWQSNLQVLLIIIWSFLNHYLELLEYLCLIIFLKYLFLILYFVVSIMNWIFYVFAFIYQCLKNISRKNHIDSVSFIYFLFSFWSFENVNLYSLPYYREKKNHTS